MRESCLRWCDGLKKKVYEQDGMLNKITLNVNDK